MPYYFKFLFARIFFPQTFLPFTTAMLDLISSFCVSRSPRAKVSTAALTSGHHIAASSLVLRSRRNRALTIAGTANRLVVMHRTVTKVTHLAACRRSIVSATEHLTFTNLSRHEWSKNSSK